MIMTFISVCSLRSIFLRSCLLKRLFRFHLFLRRLPRLQQMFHFFSLHIDCSLLIFVLSIYALVFFTCVLSSYLIFFSVSSYLFPLTQASVWTTMLVGTISQLTIPNVEGDARDIHNARRHCEQFRSVSLCNLFQFRMDLDLSSGKR